MIERESLSHAIFVIGEVAKEKGTHGEEFGWVLHLARQALSQLPKPCDECDGRGTICYPHEGISHVASSDEGCLCPSCHGSGKVYEPELVERLSEALRQVTHGNINASLTEDRYPVIAVAVLDAINGISE